MALAIEFADPGTLQALAMRKVCCQGSPPIQAVQPLLYHTEVCQVIVSQPELSFYLNLSSQRMWQQPHLPSQAPQSPLMTATPAGQASATHQHTQLSAALSSAARGLSPARAHSAVLGHIAK
uniref:Uncharacterized protein n=1 Tax=Falco tinnunculus TaxID=100819 RepID=A0A8C4TRF5_FALTI